MDERMLFLAMAYFKVLLILQNSISHVYSKDCWIKRDKRDRIIAPMNKTHCTPSNNPCALFGGILELTESAECICVCPRIKSTYMETTDKCTSLSDVQSKCSFTFKRQASIPVMPIALELNIQKKFNRRCRINRKKSFYLSGSVWKQLPATDKFPFALDKRIVRGRIHSAYVKRMNRYVPSRLNGKVFRLGISCGRRNDCVTFKIPGKTLDQCIISPTSANHSPISSILFPSYVPSKNTKPSAIPTRKHTIASEPSGTSKNSRASSSVKVPWSVIGAIIGILITLILCIIILVLCFWRRKAKSSRKTQAGNASSRSSGMILSSAQNQPEVTYASPNHPYQELKPPPSGTPRGVYQPLNWTAREDASGYMLPSESTATNQPPDPLYNEIGSPRRPLPPVYDYALPENTVRISNHLSNIDLSGINGLPNACARNEPDYVGRASKDQQEPKSPPLESAAPAPVNDEPPCTSPLYLDLSSEDANQPGSYECKSSDSGGKEAPLSTRYKKLKNGPKSTFEKSSPNERPYSILESPTSPSNQPIRLLTENLQDTGDKESKA